eukprot:1508784-Prymnesium_polylepis.1
MRGGRWARSCAARVVACAGDEGISSLQIYTFIGGAKGWSVGRTNRTGGLSLRGQRKGKVARLRAVRVLRFARLAGSPR